MNRHLVTVEVGVKCRTYERMQLDRLTFYQDRFESLNTESVQCRSTVQHHRMLFDHFFQHIPHLGIQPLHQLLGILDILGNASGHQFFHHKRLKQLDRHLLGQTALIDLKLRPDHDNGTSGIVHTLTQKVLTETSRLTF